MLRTLTFGDLESGVWGLAWDLGANQPGLTLVGDRTGTAAPTITLADDWGLSGDGVELESEVEGVEQSDQLATVRGHLRIGGSDHHVSCNGRRAMRLELDPQAFDSVRDVSAWFGADDGIALTATRPRRSSGHQDDDLTAVVFEAGHALPVVDARLSTSYDGNGLPTRAGVELWLVPPGEDDDSTDDAHRYPRRASGEAAGTVAQTTAGPLTVEARLFRWHGHGRVGAGVYALARSR